MADKIAVTPIALDRRHERRIEAMAQRLWAYVRDHQHSLDADRICGHLRRQLTAVAQEFVLLAKSSAAEAKQARSERHAALVQLRKVREEWARLAENRDDLADLAAEWEAIPAMERECLWRISAGKEVSQRQFDALRDLLRKAVVHGN